MQKRKEAQIVIKQENQIKQDRHYDFQQHEKSQECQARQIRGHNLQQEQLVIQHEEIQTGIQRHNEAQKWNLHNGDRTQTHNKIQQQQDLHRKVEVQPNIHEEKLPPESQQKQPVSPLSPSATRKYHLSHISKTPQCEALTPAESSTLNVNNSLASLRTPQQQRRLVNPLSVGTETTNATPATRIPLVKLKRVLSNSKPKIARSNSAGKISPVKEELYSRKALRSVDQSKKKKPQPLCDGLFNTSTTEKHSSPCKLDYDDEFVPTSSNAEVPRSFDGFSVNASQKRETSSLSTTKELTKLVQLAETSSYPCSIQIGTRFVPKELEMLFHGADEKDITIFSLLPTSSNESTILALGASDICMVKLLQNQSMGEVQWASHRKAIASLTLTGDGTGAKLTCLDGLSSSQTLLFSSCLECLRFAQEFYGVKPPSVRSPIVKNINQFEGDLAKPQTQNNNVPSQGKVRIDDFPIETDKRGEVNENSASPLPIPGPVSSSEQLSNESEEEIAVKYRNLLKTSTRKAVKHRMMMDRIPSKIMNVVLSYGEGTVAGAKIMVEDDGRRVSEDTTNSDPRSALFASLINKKEVPEDKSNSDPRSALFAAIKSKKGLSANNKEKEPLKKDPATKVSQNEDARKRKDGDEITAFQENRLRFEAFSPGVARLENFLLEAKSSMESLKLKENHAIETCRKMANYLGESGGEKSVSQILSVLSGFVSLLCEAIRKHDEREEAMKRKTESAKKKAQHTHATPATMRKGKSVNINIDNSAFADELLKRNEVKGKKSLMANSSNQNQSHSFGFSVSDGSPENEQQLSGCNATEAVVAVLANISPFGGRKEASKNSMDSTGSTNKANKGQSNYERNYGPSSSTHLIVPRHNNVNNNVVLKKQYTIVEQGGRKVLHVATVSDSQEDCSRQNS